VAGLLAGAFSMAAGELVSVRAQDELVQRELQVERQELTEHPNAERRELAAMYRAQGVSAEDAETVAGILSRYEQAAFETHARLELGVDPKAGGSAVQASVASFLSFAIGAFLPLIPWLFSGGLPAPGECPDRGAEGRGRHRADADRDDDRLEPSRRHSDSSQPQSWLPGSPSESGACWGWPRTDGGGLVHDFRMRHVRREPRTERARHRPPPPRATR
jgi:hypothetical protein